MLGIVDAALIYLLHTALTSHTESHHPRFLLFLLLIAIISFSLYEHTLCVFLLPGKQHQIFIRYIFIGFFYILTFIPSSQHKKDPHGFTLLKGK